MTASPSPTYRLVRRPLAPAPAPTLDTAQQRVVDHRGGPLLVLAGPGTGKTTTLVEAVIARVADGLAPEQALVLTFSRRAAADLRQRITARLGRTTTEPVARTFHSYAFGLLHREAVQRGERAPRLLAGAEQDMVIRELLAGDIADDIGRWPADLRPALRTRGFTQELRDLMLRAIERGVGADGLERLGRQRRRDDWVAAARFLRQYQSVTALAQGTELSVGRAYDPAELIRAVIDAFTDDGELLERERAARQVVFVDEYQDTDPAQEELLQLLAGGGRDLVVVGDPDQSIYTFRGTDVAAIRRFPERFRTRDGSAAPTVALTVSRRSGPVLLDAFGRVSSGLRGPVRHRALSPTDGAEPGAVEAHVLLSANQQASYIAHRLREAHLRDDVPWSQMAILVRSTRRTLLVLRRAFLSVGVPVAVGAAEVPLVDQPAVRPLLLLLDAALAPGPLDPLAARELLLSPYGGADNLGVRRLAQALRSQEVAAGGRRPSAELVAEALTVPDRLVLLEDRVARHARRVAGLIEAARTAAAADDASAETVLWGVWSASRLAQRWQQASLSGGRAGAAADRDLDAMVALFEAAAGFVDRLPGLSPQAFVEHLLDQQIPGDSLAQRAPTGEAVQILTAHAAKGLEWDLVVLAGVQEGSWPTLRARGSLLGSEDLVDVVADRDPSVLSTVAQLLEEERRLFYVAVTRARRLLIVTAVAGEDEQPSRFLDELVPTSADERQPTEVPRMLSLPALVAELRTAQLAGATDAARVLGRLAAEHVPGAHPDDWYALPDLSVTDPLVPDGEPVRISPSKVKQFSDCQLRWLLESVGATNAQLLGASLGTLVHDAADQARQPGQQTVDALMSYVDSRWGELDLGQTWVSTQTHQRAEKMVEKLADFLAGNPRELLASEQPFEVAVGRAVLRGRVDRLERDAEGRLVVVDLKTTRGKPTAEEVKTHPQLGGYQVAVDEGGFGEGERSGGASLVQIGDDTKKFTEQQQVPLDAADDPKWADALVRDTAERMAGAVFTATTSTGCGYCPVRSSCPAQPEGRGVTD